MNQLSRFLLLLLLAPGAPLWAQDSTSAYSLQQCIDYGLQHQASLKESQLLDRQAGNDIGEARAPGLPQINGHAEIIDNINIQQQFLPANAFDPSAPSSLIVPIAFGVQYQGNAYLEASQMLFNGNYFIGLKAAKTYRELTQKQLATAKEDVAANISKAYYGVLINESRIDLTEANLTRIDSLLRETRAMYEAGFAEKIDVQRIQIAYNNQLTERDRTLRAIELSYALLKFQMGMPQGDEIKVAGDLESALSDVDSANVTAEYENRSEYQSLMTQRELAELSIKNENVNYLPRLNLFGRFGYNTGANELGDVFSGTWQDYALIGLSLDVPIFDGLGKKYRVQTARIEVQRIENQMELLENNIDLQTTQARINLLNSAQTLAVQRENVELATEVYDISRIKYQEGLGSNFEVVEAESDLTGAELNYYAAIYDVLIADIDLKRARGELKAD